MALGPEELIARLAELGIAAETRTHPAVHTVEEYKRLRGPSQASHGKCLFLKDRKGVLWLVVAHEDTRVDLKALEKKLGAARFSFASAELMEEVLGVTPGAVTPLAVVNDTEGRVNVVIEEAMMSSPRLGFHPLVNTRTTELAPGGLIAFLDATGHAPRLVTM